MNQTSFVREFLVYIGRVREFTRRDWLVYITWVGLMLGLVVSTLSVLLVGRAHGVQFPAEAWCVPMGAAIFALAISIDTIGHRTIYKEVLRGGEQLVHHITIFAGITSCVALVLAYPSRTGYAIVAAVMTGVSVMYSLIDEVFHWRRYIASHADRVEMWSHVFIFVGHGIMMAGWWVYYLRGYAGMAETLRYLP